MKNRGINLFYIILAVCNIGFVQDVFCQETGKVTEINNTGFASVFKSNIASFTLRRLYGDVFNQWENIQHQREDFMSQKMYAIDDAVFYVLFKSKEKLCGDKPQILNLALSVFLDPEFDTYTDKYCMTIEEARSRDTSIVFIYPENTAKSSEQKKDTIYLYYENDWCRAFKYLVIQHMISYSLGEDFDLYCLPQDGSQQYNLSILGDSQDFLHITKEISTQLLSKSSIYWYIKSAHFYYPALDYTYSMELDSIAGKYYEEYLKHKKK
ncbi:MAG: hypothetical protein J5I59_13515 [Saprospiraceae bacterium]|nr:hypothetical protein [Saprospiraceae bacterium]